MEIRGYAYLSLALALSFALFGCSSPEPVPTVAPSTASEPSTPTNLAPSPATTKRPQWQEAGRQGTARFAVINEGDLRNEDTYRDAIASLCATEPVCQVKFWKSDAEAARSLPMTDAQVAAIVANYLRNLNTGRNELQFACSITPGPSCI